MCVDCTLKDTPKLARPLRRPIESCVTKVPAETTSHVKCETPRQHGFKISKTYISKNGNILKERRERREKERMDRLLFDKYCEMWWRVGGVFIADININFPGAALLAQRGLSTGKLERKFSKQLGSGIKEPGLRDLWHTELLANPETLSCCLSAHTFTCAATHNT